MQSMSAHSTIVGESDFFETIEVITSHRFWSGQKYIQQAI